MSTRKYSTPELKKGKEITSVPKGSSKTIEQAKQTWFVQYMYEGKQIRVKGGLNRIKDYAEKAYEAEVLLNSVKEELKKGFNPLKPKEFIEALRKEYILLSDAIQEFKEYHKKHGSRPKTISTYLSKLNSLSAQYPDILLKDLTTKHLEDFVLHKITNGKFSQDSVKSAKRILNAFFTVMIKLGNTQVNPKIGFDNKIQSHQEVSDKHVPYTDPDLKKVFQYLDTNDKYTAFYARMIYYTCIRPGEIRGLKVKDIDLKKRLITIRASVKKSTTNSKSQTVEIVENFMKELEQLDLENCNPEHFLVGSTTNIIGEVQVGINTPYQKLITSFKNIDKKESLENPYLKDSEKLQNKGYDLYSFKHTSNIKKYNSGWTLAQIMKANRHTSVSMTELYLKKLGAFTETKHLNVPAI
jgi:integrase